MLSQLHKPRNRLFLALPSAHLHRLRPVLDEVTCAQDEVLIDTDHALDQVYFPESAVVSLSTVFADGTAVDMASIGREGCTGVQAVLGAKVLLADMLGVRRPTMTNALGEFERAGLIAGARRQVTILDPAGLAEESCECYERLRERFGVRRRELSAAG